MIGREETPAMTTLHRILCPVDLSEASRRALDYALALGRQHDAAVRAVQVVDLGSWVGMSVEGVDIPMTGQTLAALEEQLGWWVARGIGGGAGASTEVREGAVGPGILAAAEELGAHLIVMATHGRTGFQRLAMGSVAEVVLRTARCPVLVVPSREDAVVRTGTLTRVVCAMDFSASASRTLAWARLFVPETSPHALSLVHVVDWPFGDAHSDQSVLSLRERLGQDATALLRRLVVGEEDLAACRPLWQARARTAAICA